MAEEKQKKTKFVFTIIQCRKSVKLTIEHYVKAADLNLKAIRGKFFVCFSFHRCVVPIFSFSNIHTMYVCM